LLKNTSGFKCQHGPQLTRVVPQFSLCRKLISPIFVAPFFVDKKIRAVSSVNMALN